LRAFTRITISENIAVILGGMLIYSFAAEMHATQHADSCNTPYTSASFLLGSFLLGFDAVCSSMLSMVVAKQWVAALYGSSSTQLAGANALLARIDLGVAVISPLLVSFIIKCAGGYFWVLVLLVLSQNVCACALLWHVRLALSKCPTLISRSAGGGGGTPRDTMTAKKHSKGVAFIDGFGVFRAMALRSQLVMAAFVLLFFTILSPGAMLTAWLKSAHVQAEESTIAIFRSIIQACGALATLVTPALIRRAGLYDAATSSQAMQTLAVLVAAFFFHQLHLGDGAADAGAGTSGSGDSSARNFRLYYFLGALALSRVGLWSFDLVERQVLQQEVPDQEQQTLLFNFERSLTQAAQLCMLGFCVLFPDPSKFGVLVLLSTAAVCMAFGLLVWQQSLGQSVASRTENSPHGGGTLQLDHQYLFAGGDDERDDREALGHAVYPDGASYVFYSESELQLYLGNYQMPGPLFDSGTLYTSNGCPPEPAAIAARHLHEAAHGSSSVFLFSEDFSGNMAFNEACSIAEEQMQLPAVERRRLGGLVTVTARKSTGGACPRPAGGPLW
jgi:iron-regulated transporter 1